jgi:hypothetical protein
MLWVWLCKLLFSAMWWVCDCASYCPLRCYECVTVQVTVLCDVLSVCLCKSLSSAMSWVWLCKLLFSAVWWVCDCASHCPLRCSECVTVQVTVLCDILSTWLCKLLPCAVCLSLLLCMLLSSAAFLLLWLRKLLSSAMFLLWLKCTLLCYVVIAVAMRVTALCDVWVCEYESYCPVPCFLLSWLWGLLPTFLKVTAFIFKL